MPARRPPPASTSPSEDPFVALYREHTQLQVLAERFRQVADAFERGDASARRDLAEGVEVYRRYLLALHQRRESVLAAAVRPKADPPTREALDRCAADHAAAEKFPAAIEGLAAAAASAAGRKRVSAELRRESDRFVEHHRAEHDQLYHRLRAEASPALVKKLRTAFDALAGEANAAETRLTAWASHANPSAD